MGVVYFNLLKEATAEKIHSRFVNSFEITTKMCVTDLLCYKVADSRALVKLGTVSGEV